MKLFNKLNEFSSSDYIEFLPGRFNMKWWNEESLYINEDDFYDLYDYFIEVIPSFDFHDVNEINKDQWIKIIQKMKVSSQTNIEIKYFIEWIEECLKEYEVVSVLGL